MRRSLLYAGSGVLFAGGVMVIWGVGWWVWSPLLWHILPQHETTRAQQLFGAAVIRGDVTQSLATMTPAQEQTSGTPLVGYDILTGSLPALTTTVGDFGGAGVPTTPQRLAPTAPAQEVSSQTPLAARTQPPGCTQGAARKDPVTPAQYDDADIPLRAALATILAEADPAVLASLSRPALTTALVHELSFLGLVALGDVEVLDHLRTLVTQWLDEAARHYGVGGGSGGAGG